MLLVVSRCMAISSTPQGKNYNFDFDVCFFTVWCVSSSKTHSVATTERVVAVLEALKEFVVEHHLTLSDLSAEDIAEFVQQSPSPRRALGPVVHD